jgi:hypothetical protein
VATQLTSISRLFNSTQTMLVDFLSRASEHRLKPREQSRWKEGS